jgi:hypothetical protein
MSCLKSILASLVLATSLFAQAVISGQFSTDITIGDNTGFGSPYTGLALAGEDWDLSLNLSDGNVNVEEAKYNWAISDAITATFGSQAEPYGIAWGLHRPAANSFVSSPRDHNISNGASIAANAYGVGVDAFYGGDITDDTGESSAHWAVRVSYGVSLLGIDADIGLSVNGDDAQLVDASSKGSALGVPYEVSFEYDLANEDENGESSPSYWLRGVITPAFAKGAYGLIGYNSDEEVLYGVGYNCNDNLKLATELSGDGDKVIRVSYTF